MDKKPNIKILVCCHKDDPAIQWEEPYMPIHVGKALHPELDLHMQGDNTGDNISEKNESYCELTGMYWAWKNLKDVDIIGLCHYRRYFDFHKQCKKWLSHQNYKFEDSKPLNFSFDSTFIKLIINGKIIVPKKKLFTYPIYLDYCLSHYSDDFRTFEKLINKSNDKLLKYHFFKYMYFDYGIRPFNMFIMNWENFDNYCNWLFKIIFSIENEIDISNYSSYQKRVFGFLSERLFNIWIKLENKSIISKNIINIDNNYTNPSFLRTFCTHICAPISTFFSSFLFYSDLIRFHRNCK